MALNCAEQKAIKLLSELEKKAGLIERKRQGLGKPNLIYVKNFISAVDSQLLNCENHNSGTMEITTPELPKSQCNNTDIKNTEFSDTDSIFPSGNGGMMDENDRYQEYFDYFSDQLSMDLLKKDYPYDSEMLDNILELIVETVCTKRPLIRIGAEERPAEIVRSRFMKLNVEHIRYVMDCFKESTIEMLIYQATKRVSQYVLKDEKEFVEQLKAQYELQCEKDNTDDKKELLKAKRRMMDLDDLIKGLYENFTLGRLPERQFNRLMTEYDTEQSNLEQRISELETATERISTKAVQIDKFVRLVKKYRDFEELTTPMLNDFIEKVVIHEAEGGRTKDRTQQVDIYFNFIGNFVLPLSEDEVEALQSEEARRAEEIAERKRKSSKKSTQKRNQKRAEIKAKAEAGDPEAMAEYKAILEKGRQNNRKRSEKMRELRMSDPEYRAKMEEKERLALEREKKRQERATKKKKIALAELKEQAEKGNQEAVRELEERRAIARERSRKSAEKRKQRAENDPEYAKYLEERNAEYNRRHTARRKEQMEALRARAEAGDQEAQSQLAERKQYQVRATVKSYRKMRDDALSGDPIAKVRYEKTLAMRREAYHAKKSEQTA